MLPILSIVSLHPRDFVVSANQSRADRSWSDREARDMPISVSPLNCRRQSLVKSSFSLKMRKAILTLEPKDERRLKNE